MERLLVWLRIKNKVIAPCSLYCWKCHGRRAAAASASRGDASQLERSAAASRRRLACQHSAERLHANTGPAAAATRGCLRLHLQGTSQDRFGRDLTTLSQFHGWGLSLISFLKLASKFPLCMEFRKFNTFSKYSLGGAVNRNSILFWMFLLLFHTHYMFRPLRAIIKWSIYLSILRSYLC
jgi:hypothetical protein